MDLCSFNALILEFLPLLPFNVLEGIVAKGNAYCDHHAFLTMESMRCGGSWTANVKAEVDGFVDVMRRCKSHGEYRERGTLQLDPECFGVLVFFVFFFVQV